MLLSNSGREKFFFPPCSGMHDKSSETRTILCLQCLSSANKHSHRQHSSVTVLRRTTATRECQGQSLAQAWRNMPSCEISGTGLLNLSSSRLYHRKFLEIQHSAAARCVEVLTFRRWHSEQQSPQARRNVRGAIQWCFFFFLFFNVSCETCGWKV